MSTIVIQVENLSKEYRLGTINHGTLKRDLQSWWARLRDKEDPNARISSDQSRALSANNERFWGLRDVSFEVNQGDVVGIIGRNGAGKSTLLKILSRVTAPTKGSLKIKGRIASLLEVGTGFHPELTGRENVFVNGAILGMTKKEINNKFDEIISFAEIDKFIDTPVKRYSSGMYVRLAFAVAAHLEPEILIIDEVLAVGDAQFQMKCLGKMENVSKKDGRTILFVSHNMAAITALCNKGIVLNAGEITYKGDCKKAVSIYNGHNLNNELSLETCSQRAGSGGIKITKVWITNAMNEITHIFSSLAIASINLTADVGPKYQHNNISVGIAIDSSDGKRIFTVVSSWGDQKIRTNGPHLTVRCILKSIPLIPDKYLISVSIIDQGDTLDVAIHCLNFEIDQNDLSHLRAHDSDYGYLDIPYDFEINYV